MRAIAAAGAALAFVATPGDLYHQAIADAVQQTSAHYVVRFKGLGSSSVIVGDAARDRGVQHITFTQTGTTGHVVVIVANRTAYVRGDAFTLQFFMGLTPEEASRFTGKWFFVKPTSSPYHAFAAAVTLSSFVSELAMPGPYTSVPHGVRSHFARSGIRWTGTLFVTSGNKPLPVKEVMSGSLGRAFTTVVGRWNEKVVATAPRGAVPLS